jgi:2-oxoglutarate dehydrogenase E2 component (dihydrolipoamide succinyltransferase)
MAKVDLIMPKMGESIMEATILKWSKSVGDQVELDETVLEIATDKVDSEIPSPVAGKLIEIKYAENDVVEVGKVIAIIATEGEEESPKASPAVQEKSSSNGNGVRDNDGYGQIKKTEPEKQELKPAPQTQIANVASPTMSHTSINPSESSRFYSPLVRNMAKAEQISTHELDAIEGSGLNGRVTKRDIEQFLANRTEAPGKVQAPQVQKQAPVVEQGKEKVSPKQEPTVIRQAGPNEEIIQMDRMRKLIAEHMVRSKHTSPHVTSFVEVDVTDVVHWRNKIKAKFQEEHGEKITFTPIFIQAIAKAIIDFPMINITVDGDSIIRKKDINIGMAAALPSGNLIVPVIHNADYFNLVGLTKKVNDLANRARQNQLKPEEIQGGTFTLTNVGTFGNVMGTPIINQPQVAIMAAGAIRKKPAVMETEYGDVIAVRHMMYLSLSYDHRVVDGFLGGSFLSKVGYYLEHFDVSQQ